MRDDECMTNNQSLRSLAQLAFDTYYAPIDDLTSYFRAELMIRDDDTIDSIDDLITALDIDIRDLIKNANLRDLIPFADDLDDDDYHDLSTRLRNDSRFPALIARRILDNARR